MGRGRLLGGCAWLLGGLALLQTLYLRALPPPRSPLPHRRSPPPMPPPRGVLDTSGTFQVYRDLLGPPPHWDPPELVLATHGTPGRVAGTLGGALGGLWGGPLSVAVFGVPKEGLGGLLAALGGPCRGLRARLRLHVVVGAAAPPPIVPPNPGPPTPGGCRGALRRLAAADPPSYTLGVPYPGNLLRNVAWVGAAEEERGGPSRNGGPGPPKTGGRFVLLLDADVVPSRGLREEFLRLLGEGGAGLHPPKWGAGGAWGDPLVRGAAGVLGDPRTQRAPGGLRVPGVPSDPRLLNALEVPNRLGVPSVPGVPNVPSVPNTIGNGGVPHALEVPKVPNAFSDPGVPNALEVPKGFRDPGVPNTLEDPNFLKDPKALEDSKPPGATTPSWDQVVFVLPAFEVRAGTRVPGTKAELLQLWGTGDARPFYGALCPRCQAPTGYERWWALPPTPHLRVAYEAPWRDPWEPFYVGPAHGVPPFDERFLQYGFNRISQVLWGGGPWGGWGALGWLWGP